MHALLVTEFSVAQYYQEQLFVQIIQCAQLQEGEKALTNQYHLRLTQKQPEPKPRNQAMFLIFLLNSISNVAANLSSFYMIPKLQTPSFISVCTSTVEPQALGTKIQIDTEIHHQSRKSWYMNLYRSLTPTN